MCPLNCVDCKSQNLVLVIKYRMGSNSLRDSEAKFAGHKSMICPAVCSTHILIYVKC